MFTYFVVYFENQVNCLNYNMAYRIWNKRLRCVCYFLSTEKSTLDVLCGTARRQKARPGWYCCFEGGSRHHISQPVHTGLDVFVQEIHAVVGTKAEALWNEDRHYDDRGLLMGLPFWPEIALVIWGSRYPFKIVDRGFKVFTPLNDLLGLVADAIVFWRHFD